MFLRAMINNVKSFIEGATYHVYNRGNGHDRIFRNPGNYDYFLNKYWEYMSPHWDTNAWCLMPNHFHFIITVRPHLNCESVNEKCWRSFANFCNGYVQAFNKQHRRRGSLFMRGFRRKLVNDDEYLKTLVCYVHNNPIKDGFVPSAENWHYSSYKELLHAPPLQYEHNRILKLFGDHQQLKQDHLLFVSPGSINIPYMAA